MTANILDLRPFGNTSSGLSPDERRMVRTLYDAHFPDARIAQELQIPLASIVAYRLARFLQPK